jgi:hypothetical protein
LIKNRGIRFKAFGFLLAISFSMSMNFSSFIFHAKLRLIGGLTDFGRFILFTITF